MLILPHGNLILSQTRPVGDEISKKRLEVGSDYNWETMQNILITLISMLIYAE